MASSNRGLVQRVILHTSSRTRAADAPSNCVIRLDHPVRARRYQVTAASIPGTYYTLPADAAAINYDIGGGDVSLALTPGVYTAAGLASHVQARLQTADATFTCAYSAATLRFTIARGAGNFDLNFDPAVDEAASYLALILGYAQATLTGAATYTSTSNVLVAGPSVALLESSALSAGTPLKIYSEGERADQRRVVARIPLAGVSGGSVSHFSAVLDDEDTPFAPSGEMLRDIDLRLVDADTGRELVTNADFSVEVSIVAAEGKYA